MHSEAMIVRVDDETVRLLMEGISYLTGICEKNDLDFDVNNLPHCKKLNLYKIEQLKDFGRYRSLYPNVH